MKFNPENAGHVAVNERKIYEDALVSAGRFTRCYPPLFIGWAVGLLLCGVLSAFSLATSVMWLMYIGSGLKLGCLFTLFLLFSFECKKMPKAHRFPTDSFFYGFVAFVVLASVFRMVFKQACYGGLNTFGSGCFLILLGIRLSFLTRRITFAEFVPLQRWISAISYVTAVLLWIMLFALATFNVSAMQTVFSFTFYTSQLGEFIFCLLSALFYFSCNRIVNSLSFERISSEG